MEKTKINPLATFRYLLTGSATARNLSFLYVCVSLLLAYYLRAHIEYIVPLGLGALLVIWYTLTFLNLKQFNLKTNELQYQVRLYRAHILKREKYESSVFFIWFLTIVPAVLFGEEITIATVIVFMTGIYSVFMLGSYLFTKARKTLEDLEIQINKLN